MDSCPISSLERIFTELVRFPLAISRVMLAMCRMGETKYLVRKNVMHIPPKTIHTPIGIMLRRIIFLILLLFFRRYFSQKLNERIHKIILRSIIPMGVCIVLGGICIKFFLTKYFVSPIRHMASITLDI